MTYRTLGLLGILVLSGCASQPGNNIPSRSSSTSIELDELYIRGVFNWWEAKENHRINEKRNQGAVDVDLIADGQPYDFKFSNQYWSPSQTCGGSYTGQLVSIQSTLYLTCGTEAKTLQFTPSDDGTYRFILTDVNNGDIRLDVVKIK